MDRYILITIQMLYFYCSSLKHTEENKFTGCIIVNYFIYFIKIILLIKETCNIIIPLNNSTT